MLVEMPISYWFNLHFALPVELGYSDLLTPLHVGVPTAGLLWDIRWLFLVGHVVAGSRMRCSELCEAAAHSFSVFSCWSPV